MISTLSELGTGKDYNVIKFKSKCANTKFSHKQRRVRVTNVHHLRSGLLILIEHESC